VRLASMITRERTMIVNGRNHPIASAHRGDDGELVVRVDFELDPAAWVEIIVTDYDLSQLDHGGEIRAGAEKVKAEKKTEKGADPWWDVVVSEPGGEQNVVARIQAPTQGVAMEKAWGMMADQTKRVRVRRRVGP
jgi:hypothetical protein